MISPKYRPTSPMLAKIQTRTTGRGSSSILESTIRPSHLVSPFIPILIALMIRSQAIPLSSLCICPRKAVWALYIDVVCINYDGNAFDAAVLAVMAALKSSKSPPFVCLTWLMV
jgi:hypothetical protein